LHPQLQPPLRRELKHTLKNIRRTGEFVVNLADEGTANAMHASSAEMPEAESEFAQTGLTPVPARMVKHPRIAEAAASLECRVERRIEFGPERELVIGEILLDPRARRHHRSDNEAHIGRTLPAVSAAPFANPLL
jgi:flavin reductase (DIM6/NTAB) family NADH-FMN oxidoreductase RutF